MKKSITIFAFCLTLLSGSLFAQNEQYKAYLVSDAHFDTQWNWDVQTSINEFIPKTLNQNLFLLEKYPNYVFNFEGGIKYSWMKEYYPHEYEMIKKYIKEGRWHIAGSTWDATDANVPSPESLTRNILYGQEYYQDEFGAQGTDIFLPDCFGFGWTLPSIAAHSGLIGFSTQKLIWRHLPFYGNSKIPFEMGLWQGVDGNKIMLIADAHNYTTKWKDEDLSKSNYLLNIAKASPTKAVYHYYGTGDTGGAPDIQSVRTVEQSLQGEGPLKIISATSDQIYKDYLPFENHKELPVFNGELLMDVHGTGCYTSQAAMKKYNRKNESLAFAAEGAAVIADWLNGIEYPKQKLSDAWKRFIWHQFHDDLTGTSIPKAYEFSWNDELISMKQFAGVLTNSVGSVSGSLNTNVKGIPVVIYNPVANPVSDMVEIEVNLPKKGVDFKVLNEKGESVPVQILENNNEKTRLLIAVTVPSCGFVVYDLQTASAPKVSTLKVTDNSIENRFYKIRLNKNGDMASIFDKINNRELVKKGKSIRLALFTENESFAWPAWEVLKKTIDKEPISISDDVKISVAENGPNRSALCVERKYKESTFKQFIRLTDGGQDDRIDVYNEVDWETTNALLKAEFPLNLTSEEAVYDLGLGNVKRGNNTKTAYEVYAQNWAGMNDKNEKYGVSILNDCKYGWDKPDNNTLRLTLLHTPKTKGGYAYQNKQDFGQHTFTYSIYGHQQDENWSKT
ncbi:MAG: alpha-mannosidase, partial [Paludibacter sp.]